MPVVYLQTVSTRSLWLYLPSTIGWGYFWGWSLVNWFLSLHSSLNSPFEMMNAKSLSLKCLYKLLTSAKFLNYNVIQILKGFGRHQGRGLWLHQSHSFTRNTHPSGVGGWGSKGVTLVSEALSELMTSPLIKCITPGKASKLPFLSCPS